MTSPSDMGPTDGATGRDKAWADGVRARWRDKYGRDPLEVWGKPALYRLPSGKEALGDTVARCNRFRMMGAVRIGK
jgi:hypothetical protein